MRSRRAVPFLIAATATLALSACSSSADSDGPAGATAPGNAEAFPVVVEHALGTTTIEEKPERVATVAWANQEVPLALGVVPVGMAAANFGDDDGDEDRDRGQ